MIVVSLNSVAGGVMGYMKSGSQKSSALVLYFVHTQLPVRPVFASSIGLGMQIPFFSSWSFGNFLCLEVRPTWILSHDVVVDSALQVYLAALLSVMGSRFKKSGKMFPAGVVSHVSLVMVGGYYHGIFFFCFFMQFCSPLVSLRDCFFFTPLWMICWLYPQVSSSSG